MDALLSGLTWFNDNVLYYPVLIILLLGAGLYFSIKTGFVQLRLLGESVSVVNEKAEEGEVTGFQALMVTVGSKVGTGNIIGVSTAICLGGYGAVFWMWVTGLVGASLAFIESTLAQIYKRRDPVKGSYGGPSYYMEHGLNSKFLGIIFSIALILTYGVGFNALASFNLQSSFEVYGFYNETTPWIIGAVLALFAGYCILGGGERIVKAVSAIVPIMGGAYVVVAIIVVVLNITRIPEVFGLIFSDAFNFQAILGGIAGSSLMYGIKRGLYSNEAGMGSAPNAAASAATTHPAKQGLVQMLSVFIVTFGICTATALMSMATGVEATPEKAGSPYVQEALSSVFGQFGNIFITLALVFFAFTTLLGNLYYVDSNLTYLNGNKKPSNTFMLAYRIIAIAVIFFGATLEMDLAWSLSDLLMGLMCLINIPVIIKLGGIANRCLQDYVYQKGQGLDPVFKAENIDMDTSRLDYWK